MRRARWPASGHPGTVLEEVRRMVATGGRVMTTGFALTVMALLLPGLAYGTAVMSQTAARSVAVVKPVTAHQSAATVRPVPAHRSVTAAGSCASQPSGCGCITRNAKTRAGLPGSTMGAALLG